MEETDNPRNADSRIPPNSADVLRGMGTPVVTFDGALVVTSVNPAMCEVARAFEDELVGASLPLVWWWPTDAARWTRVLEATLEGAPQSLVARIRGRNADPVVVAVETRALRDDGALVGVVMTVTPTPMRSLHNAAAAAGEFTAIIEDSPDAIVRWDRDMRMSYMNRAAELNSGVPREDVLGCAHHEMPGYSADYIRSVMRVMSSGEPHEDEFEYRNATNDPIFVRTRYLPEIDADGNVQAVIALSQDVTGHKLVELELARLVRTNTRSAQREAAFRRVAEMIAAGSDLETVCEVVSREAVALLGASQAWVTRTDEGGDGRFVGGSSSHGDEAVRPDGGARRDAPVLVEGQQWGVLSVMVPSEATPDVRATMHTLSDLVATACMNHRTVGELELMAHTDSMTGLLNRRAFFENLEAEIRRARRHDDDLALAIIDLDHFKRVNDEYGHGTGDEVLCTIAGRLASTVRRGEILARIGGEEFAWILPRVDLETAAGVLERARGIIASDPLEGVGIITLSAGLAALREDDSEKQLMSRADDALYRAKHNGRNRVEIESD